MLAKREAAAEEEEFDEDADRANVEDEDDFRCVDQFCLCFLFLNFVPLFQQSVEPVDRGGASGPAPPGARGGRLA